MSGHVAAAALLLPILLAAAPLARADIVDEANQIRARGCSGRPGVTTPLSARKALDDAARLVSVGVGLREALGDVGYRGVKSFSVRITSRGDDASLASTLRDRLCSQLTDRRFGEIGVHRSREQRWIILAAPFSAPALVDARAVSRRVLALVNQARSHSRRCGRERFAATAPLKLLSALERAARAHADDMAKHGYLDHTGRDGSTPGTRLNRTGYQRRLVAENIAAGPRTPEEAVQGWLESPGHCANIMDKRFRDMGVAYTFNPSSKHGVYWAQVLAAPR
ncbi:MAG: CAP domain-containing protein [Gammaproteobacteria bacterium]